MATQEAPVIEFGFVGEQGVELQRFAPDAEGLYWFEATGEVKSLDEFEEVGDDESSTSGKCVDTGEWLSPAARIVESMLGKAPTEAKLAVIAFGGFAGTRTWAETYKIKYYK